MANNTFTDNVSPFNINLSRKLPFYRAFQFPNGYPLPTTITGKTYNVAGGRLLPDNYQAQHTLTENIWTVQYADTDQFPISAWHEVYFDGKLVFEGRIAADFRAALVAQSDTSLIVQAEPETQALNLPGTSDPLAILFRDQAEAARDIATSAAETATQQAGIATDAASTATEQAESIQNVLTQYVLLTTLQNYSTTTAMNTAIQSAINALVGSAPGMLDTLNELASAIGNDPNFSTTILNALAGKPTVQTVADVAALNAAATGALAKLLVCLSDPSYDDSESTLNMWTGSKLKIFIAQDREE